MVESTDSNVLTFLTALGIEKFHVRRWTRRSFRCMAADTLTGQAQLISGGDAMSAVLASCAIPGVYLSVRREDRWLCDGALAGPVQHGPAVEVGADRVSLLPGGTACARIRAPRSAAAAEMHSVTLLLEQRALAEVAPDQEVVDLWSPASMSARGVVDGLPPRLSREVVPRPLPGTCSAPGWT